MSKAIVHIDMNRFYVSCERLTNSELKGIPLIIGGGERGVAVYPGSALYGCQRPVQNPFTDS